MKTAKITAKINNANPINKWVSGFILKTNNGHTREFNHRHEAKAYATHKGYRII